MILEPFINVNYTEAGNAETAEQRLRISTNKVYPFLWEKGGQPNIVYLKLQKRKKRIPSHQKLCDHSKNHF